MHVKKMKVLTGTMLSLLLSAVAVYPAMARPIGKLESGQLIGQTSPTDTTPGGTMTPGGTTTPGDTTTPGGTMTPGGTTTPTDTTPSNTSPTDNAQTIRGTIRSIRGNTLTVQQPDGTTRDIMLPAGEVARQSLRPGMQISATLDNQNMATNVSVLNNRTRTTEEQTIRRRTTVRRRTTTPARAQTTPQRTSAPAQQQPTESAPAAASPTPVRALW